MKITGKTKIIGLFGYPVIHSLSPLLHNTAFAEIGLDCIYVSFPVRPSDLKEATQAIRALNIVGVNVTIPHKQTIINHLDGLSPEATVMGAVNTVVNQNGKLVGYNTDGEGFIRSLQEKDFSLAGARVLVLGAGGTALSISFYLVQAQVEKLIFMNRTLSRPEHLRKRLASMSGKTKLEIVDFESRNHLPCAKHIDLLVNTTSLGMQAQDLAPINLEQFSPTLYVYDVIYNKETELVKQAKKLGMRHQGGLDMLVFQGALSFEMWTGRKAPVSKMREVVSAGVHYEHEI